MNKLLLLAIVTSFPTLAHAYKCDGEAANCAWAHLNFVCARTHVLSSVQSAPNTFDVEVEVGCDNGPRQVSVQVQFDGLGCRCTKVSAPGDGG